MNILSLIFRELVGMFVDDEFLAISVLAIVGLAAFCAFVVEASQIIVGGVLIAGCIGVLVLSVIRGSRTRGA